MLDEPNQPERETSAVQSSRAPDFGLTELELEVLRYIAEGLADKEIAPQMSKSVASVNKYVRSIIRKLGVSTRTEAAIKAMKAGIIE